MAGGKCTFNYEELKILVTENKLFLEMVYINKQLTALIKNRYTESIKNLYLFIIFQWM